ncbi:hypothetical protein [Streptomyces sp. NPDC002467]|uniref:hypothetical protein n=1 Tax=Streptomyces sp. NPDC002467 TaxID=3364647 RepID=UPI0036985DFB
MTESSAALWLERPETRAEAERLEAVQAAAQELADRAGADVAAAEDDARAAGERLETARAAGTDAAARLKKAGRAAVKVRARARTMILRNGAVCVAERTVRVYRPHTAR